MSLEEKKQSLSGGEIKRETPPPKEEKKDTSGFGGKPHIAREEFRSWLRRPDLYKTTGLPETERAKLEKELFGSEYGYFIEKGEPEKVMKKLEMEKFKAPSEAEKAKIDKKIKILKNFLGEK